MIRKNSLAYFLLLALEKSIEIGTPLSDFYEKPHRFVFTDYRTNLNYNNFYKAVRRLREKGYIETPKNGRQIILKLTNMGNQELILRKILENETWDGKWRVVIFDIPEKHRKVRNALRLQLRQWEFKQWQKSVWIGKKDLAKEVRKLTEKLNISDWVKVLVATEI